jgi:tripartite-type tricarboxylate transporter receptor subunit TctC
MKRRSMLTAMALSLAAWGPVADAQPAWPTRPIKVMVPFPAGGQLDVVVRLVAEKISPALGQPIVVETKLGADGNIAAEAVAKSAPDGYTWLTTSVPFATQVSLQPGKLRFDPVRDFVPVANLGTASFVLVVPNSVPVGSLAEFVAYAKARPGQLSYAGTSVGSVTHLSTEMFAGAAGIRMEMIPYAGIPAAMADLISGRTQFMSTGVIAALPQIKAGKLKPLALLAAKRHPQLPDVPTIVELGYPDLTVETWFGLLMPAGTPDAIVRRVNAEVMRALQSDDVLAKYQSFGVDAVKPHPPEAYGALLGSEIARWGKVIRDANVKVE